MKPVLDFGVSAIAMLLLEWRLKVPIGLRCFVKRTEDYSSDVALDGAS